eukprot:TRINITY_DN2001_c0_g1_i6.p1 TRINITY_DN2001_c0_g1~~TRINITY_DN2001_c0_g1_i6.p1  ORF type:complete len:391 (-),score=101.09 TRINITY_DN2001_c0_g1_i6:2617-3789(-)
MDSARFRLKHSKEDQRDQADRNARAKFGPEDTERDLLERQESSSEESGSSPENAESENALEEETKRPENLIPHIARSDSENSAQAKEREMQRKARIQQELTKIEKVHDNIANEEVKTYGDKFYDNAEDDIVTLAEVEMEDLSYESKKVQELKEKAKHEEFLKYQKQYNGIKVREMEAQDQLYHQSELMKRQVDRLEQESIMKTSEKKKKMKKSFMKVNKKLKGYLIEEKSEVVRKYKDLAIVDREDVNKLRRGSGSRPQIVKIRLQVARCLKDKLPKGRYAILCSILDRVGGSPLKLDSKEASTWRKVSTPRVHSGEYSLNNLRFEKTVHLVVPAANKVSPSMVYLFELFLLRSKEYTYDQVLGWGVFPMSNSEFDLNLGRFKVFLCLNS